MTELAADAFRTRRRRATRSRTTRRSLLPGRSQAPDLGRARRRPPLRVRRPLHLRRRAMPALRRPAHRDDDHVPVPRLPVRHHDRRRDQRPGDRGTDRLRGARGRRQHSNPSVTFETLNVRTEGSVLFAEIAAPPMNLLGPELVRDLVSLIQRAEADDAVRVLVFSSADPDYFISHVDVTQIAEYRQEAAKLTGEPSIALLFRHLSASRLVTIAQIEGRVRARRQRVRAGVRHALRRAGVSDLRPVRAGVRRGPRRRRRPAPRAPHGPRPSARGHAERRGLRRRARRTLRLDQPRAACRRARRVRQRRSPTGSPGFPPPATLAVKDRVNAIALAPAEDFRRDSDLFGEGVRSPRPSAGSRPRCERGMQTRDAELALARMLGELGHS